MNRLDTFTIRIPLEAIDDWNANAFTEKPASQHPKTGEPDGEFRGYSQLRKSVYENILGVFQIKIYHDAVVMFCDAHILKGKYLDGLNINTYEYFIHCINELNLIHINPTKVYELSGIMLAHVKNDFIPDRGHKHLVGMLHAYELNPSYSHKFHGDTLYIKNASNTIPIKIYSKHKHWIDSKKESMKSGKKYFKSWTRNIPECFVKDKSRVESMLTKVDTIAKYFGVEHEPYKAPLLKDVLESKEQVNIKAIKTVFSNQTRDTFITELLLAENKTKTGLQKLAMQELADKLIDTFDGDTPLIRKHVKNLVKGNPSAFMKLIKQRKHYKIPVEIKLARESVMNELIKRLRGS